MASPMKKEWSDRVNPVLIKEIRQHFHNFGILSVMGALLAGELILLAVMQYRATEFRGSYTDSGSLMFGFLVFGMTLAAYFVCSLGAMIRFTTERRNREQDFSYLTTLPPNRIVWGKLSGTLVMTVFIFALCLPFMVIAYFLRGIEMETMLLVSLAVLPAVGVASQFGILIGSAGQRWLVSLFFVASFFAGQPLAIFTVLLFTRTGGVDSPVGALLLWYGIGGIVLELLYALSVAAVGSRFSNRMLPVRISLIGAIAISPLIGLGAGLIADIANLWEPALGALVIGASCIAGFCATLAAFERQEPGERVLRKRPKNRVGYFAHFLVSSGAWGGIVLAYLMMLFAGATAAGFYLLNPVEGGDLALWVSGGCYFLFYADIAILIARRWKILPGWGWWAMTLIIAVMVPLLVSAVVSIVSKDGAVYCLLTTPFCLVKPEFGWFGPLLAVVSLVMTGGVMLKRRKRP